MTVASIEHFAIHGFFDAVQTEAKWQAHVQFVHAPPMEPPPPSVWVIAREILERHYPGITLAEIRGERRDSRLVTARWHIWSTVHALRPDLSIAGIGRLFKRDHSSILNGVRKYRNGIQGG